MVRALLSLVLSLFFYIINFAGSVIFYPAQRLIFAAFPSFGQYAVEVVNYVVQQVFPLITWIKHVLVNITTIPEELFLFIVVELFALLGMATTVRIYALLVRLYRLVKSGN